MWRNKKVDYKVEETGYVISVHGITENCILTVTRKGTMTFWIIGDGFEWQKFPVSTDTDGYIICGTLSIQKLYLAVLKEECQVALFQIPDIQTTPPMKMKVEFYMKYEYKQQLTCCSFSQDDRYLATGMDNGDISVSFSTLFLCIKFVLFYPVFFFRSF